MSMKSLINGVAVAAVTAGTLLGGLGTAKARDWHRGDDAGYARHGDMGRGHDGGRGAWAHGGGWRDERHHDYHSHVGRNVAIGAFAAVLGLALAAESQRVQGQYYDDRD